MSGFASYDSTTVEGSSREIRSPGVLTGERVLASVRPRDDLSAWRRSGETVTPGKRTAWIAAVWLSIPVLVGLVGLLLHMFMSGTKITQIVTLWFQRSFLPRGDLFTLPAVTWLWVAIGLLLTA